VSKEQVTRLCADIQTCAKQHEIPGLFVAIDQEGGQFEYASTAASNTCKSRSRPALFRVLPISVAALSRDAH
jgi:hypothetical protein